jgi:hypothetical protein
MMFLNRFRLISFSGQMDSGCIAAAKSPGVSVGCLSRTAIPFFVVHDDVESLTR